MQELAAQYRVPILAGTFAEAVKLPAERADEIFRGLAATGVEFDADGNLVGAALSVKPTPHRFRVKGRDLYAWCALDALFLPGLLDASAEVESRCPTTGEKIRLTASPHGVGECTPPEAVLTVVVPGVSRPAGETGAAFDLTGARSYDGPAWYRHQRARGRGIAGRPA